MTNKQLISKLPEPWCMIARYCEMIHYTTSNHADHEYLKQFGIKIKATDCLNSEKEEKEELDQKEKSLYQRIFNKENKKEENIENKVDDKYDIYRVDGLNGLFLSSKSGYGIIHDWGNDSAWAWFIRMCENNVVRPHHARYSRYRVSYEFEESIGWKRYDEELGKWVVIDYNPLPQIPTIFDK